MSRYDTIFIFVLSAGTKFHDYVRIFKDPYAHSIVVLTEWHQFKSYDYKKMYDSMAKPAFIVDGRNILDLQDWLGGVCYRQTI